MRGAVIGRRFARLGTFWTFSAIRLLISWRLSFSAFAASVGLVVVPCPLWITIIPGIVRAHSLASRSYLIAPYIPLRFIRLFVIISSFVSSFRLSFLC